MNIKFNHSTSSLSYYKNSFILSRLSPYKVQIFLAIVSILGAAGVVLLIGRLIKSLIDNGQVFTLSFSLELTLASVSFCILVLSLFSFGRNYYSAFLSEIITASIRKDLFEKILSLEVAYFDKTHPTDLVARLTSDMIFVQTNLQTTLPIALRNLILMLGGFSMMLWTSVKLTFLTLIIVPVLVSIGFFFGKRVRSLSKVSQDKISEVGVFVEEILTNIRTCFAFSHEKNDIIDFRELNEAAAQVAVERGYQKALLSSTVMTIAFVSMCFLVYVGIVDIKASILTPGSLSSFIFYALLVAGTAGSFAENFANIKKASGAFERVWQIMILKPAFEKEHAIDLRYLNATCASKTTVANRDVTFMQDLILTAPALSVVSSTRPYLPVTGTLAMHNVSFSYEGVNKLALEKINFTINPGEKVAIVGPSGAGKTTIFSLLMRFYDPKSGSIYVDGQDAKTLDVSTLRSRIGLVPQDPALFSSTLLDNILYGNPHATTHMLQEAIRISQLEEVIEKLPQGIKTLVGTRGVRLSGGQRQRVAIARAVLRNPSLLLLDEATSALDAENEKAVQEGLKYLTNTRSSLIIAHRLSTVLHAERIIVLLDGKINGIGTHAELCSENALYRRLATIQFGEFKANTAS